MTCSETGCEGKGERRCDRCQKELCYSCWKFFTESHAGLCSACRVPAPERVVNPEWPEWKRKQVAGSWKAADIKKKQKARRRTHCKENHPISGKNRLWANGYWSCRICTNTYRRARRAAWIEGGRQGPRP